MEKLLCYLEVDPLIKLNRSLRFDSRVQENLYNRLIGKNFTVEADYMEKLSSILPAGIEVKEITIVSIDAVELYNNYNSRLDEICKLDTKRDELLNSPL